MSRSSLIIDLQQRLRDPRFQLRLVVKARDDAFDDLRNIGMDMGLHGNGDLRSLPVKTGKSRQTIQGVSDRSEPRQRELQRALLLCLRDNLVDPRPQLKISLVEVVL